MTGWPAFRLTDGRLPPLDRLERRHVCHLERPAQRGGHREQPGADAHFGEAEPARAGQGNWLVGGDVGHGDLLCGQEYRSAPPSGPWRGP
jgi:hypothetical protein